MHKIPNDFRPLLWYLRWNDLDIDEDRHDIIVNIINYGTMEQWRWLVQTYGRQEIRKVLEQHLATEFNPGSRHLVEVLFDVKKFHAPRSIDSGGLGASPEAR